jgi:O-antigen/teichoic acid export membrane protein
LARRSFITDVFSVSGSNILSTLIQIPIGIVLARMLGPEGNGIYNYILVIPMLVSTISRLGIRKSTIYHIGKKVFSLAEVISALSLILIFTSLLAILLTGGIYLYLDRPEITVLMAGMALLSIPVNIIINYASGVFIGTDFIKRYNIFQWIPNLINLILLSVFLIVLKWSVTGALLAYLLSSMVMAYYALKLIIREYKIEIRYNLSIIKSIIQLGFSFTLAGLIIKLHYRVDILLLERFSDMKEVGYYSLGARLAERWHGPFTIGAIISSRTAISEDLDEFKHKIISWIRVTFILGLFAATLLYFLVPYLIPLLYGNKFIPSIIMVQTILPGIVVLIISKTLISFYAGLGKPYVILFTTLASLIVNVIFNLILIPTYGGIGAAMATNISYTLLSVVLLVYFAVSMKMSVSDILFFRKSDLKVLKRFKKKLIG